MRLPDNLRCLTHHARLIAEPGGEMVSSATRFLHCQHGCSTPVSSGVPRFVSTENYAMAFGRQWNTYRLTQLDSYTGTTISRDRLTRCLGVSLDTLEGKSVLEVGCGAGRFTELLLDSGAHVFASDLSSAVEANLENFRGAANYFVCQADGRELPVRPESFDYVVCLGVIQHTPDPEMMISALARYIKPGGELVIDHYRFGPEDMTASRQCIRRFLIRRSPRFGLAFVRAMVALLWPVHRFLWAFRARPRIATLRQRWLKISPLMDYHDYYAELGSHLLYAWAALDTHDALTDVFKHKRTTEEIQKTLLAIGLCDIVVAYGGNGVEARARKPAES